MATSSSTTNSSIDANTIGDEFRKDPRKICRSRTWSQAALESQYLHQQRKLGGLDELVGLDTPLSSFLTDSDSACSVQQGIREMIDEAIASPMAAPPATHSRKSPDNLVTDSGSKLEEFNPREVWVVMGLMAAAIAKPRSPKSPRLGAVDQAAMVEALAADHIGICAPSPTPAIVENAEALTSGYDDPSGVNRHLMFTEERRHCAGHLGIRVEGRSVTG